jgi:hypothetical protein
MAGKRGPVSAVFIFMEKMHASSRLKFFRMDCVAQLHAIFEFHPMRKSARTFLRTARGNASNSSSVVAPIISLIFLRLGRLATACC